MSMFYCSRCAQLRDSDDGSEEVLDRLVCSYCGDEVEEEVAEASKPWCGFCGGDCYRPDGHGYDAPDYSIDDDNETREPDTRGVSALHSPALSKGERG